MPVDSVKQVWRPDGALPPGVSEDVAVAAYRALGLKPKQVLTTMGVKLRFSESPRSKLREALNLPRHRSELSGRRPSFHQALYGWLRGDLEGGRIYRLVVEPAEVERAAHLFLDANTFRDSLAAFASVKGPAGLADKEVEILGLFVTAFGLLQPEVAQRLVEVVRAIDARFHCFFHGDTAVPSADHALRSAADHESIRTTLSQLRTGLLELQSRLFAAANGARSDEGRHPGRDLADAIVSYADAFDHVGQQIADGLGRGNADWQTLAALESALDELDAKVGARQVFRRLLGVRRTDGKPDSAIDDLAVQLRDAAAGNFDAVPAAVEGAQALLRLITELESLEEEELSALRAKVQTSFGLSLARMASRGLLTVTPAEEPPDNLATDAAQTDVPLEQEAPGSTVQDSVQSESYADADLAHGGGPEQVDGMAPIASVELASAAAELLPEVASPAIERQPPEQATETAAGVIIYEAVNRGRWSLAFHLARCLEAEPGSCESNEVLPSAVIAAAALAPRVRFSAGDIPDRFASVVQELFDRNDSLAALPAPLGPAIGALTGSSMLAPALLAPRTNAGVLIEQLTLSPPRLRELAGVVRKFNQLGLELTPALLKGVRQHAAWAEALDTFGRDVARWLEQERRANIIYAPTTDVWRHWLRSNAALGAQLERIAAGQKDSPHDLRAQARKWRDHGFVDEQLVRTDRALRGRISELRPIEARARRALRKRTDEAAGLLEAWSRLLEQEPHDEDAFRRSEAERCRIEIQRLLPGARAELSEAAAQATDVRAGACLRAADRVIASLAALFEPSSAGELPQPAVREVLHQDLLLLPGVRLTSDWEPFSYSPDLYRRLVALGDTPDVDWVGAFNAHLAHGDHLATERLLEFLENGRAGEADLDVLRRARIDDLHGRRRALDDDLARARSRLDRAVMLDLLTETELLDLRAALESVTPAACLDFASASKLLATLGEKLTTAEAGRVQLIGERLATVRERAEPAVLARIERALSERDFFVANELIDAVAEGRNLPTETSDDPFAAFFPTFVRDIADFMGGRQRRDLRDIISDISSQRSVGPIEMVRVPRAQAAEAARMLSAWYRLKNRTSGENPRTLLVGLFDALGFDGVQIEGENPRPGERRWWADLRTVPLNDREACVIPAFGSLARGHYRILCAWDRPSEEEVFTLLSGRPHHSPVLVLYLGQMSEQRRRDLAAISRTRRRSFIVIDECLILFLCAARGSRLPILFKCALPFTMCDPYVTTASLVPPEMFYGRTLEREAVISPFGTNLVYGGRQLGKTALLRDIERRYHAPAAGHMVRWIDLLPERLGEAKPVADIWNVIAAELHRVGVVSQPTSTGDRLARRVATWLAEDAARRIVLLLDEADAFLESDSRGGFAELSALKGLMDATERRFKVVFAGLHNVQRASRDPNTPLAHLGQPVCVGPLLHEREAREALGLVKLPLEALGYRFESDALPLRVLSYTNYYPSLIQIYCKHLLDYVSDPGRELFDPRHSPPYVITSAHLDAVQNNELREKILDKFRLTLNLDARYRVIALCMALAGTEDAGGDALVHGVDPAWVRQEALYWWAAGFRDDSTLEGFKTLLDEMIGLGVLRRVGDRRYALRSPNLVNLLGTKAEIAQGLLDAAEQPAKPQYEAATFRRTARDHTWDRSPLTAQQEAIVVEPGNGVVVLCGCRLAGNESVEHFVRLACESVGYETVEVTDAGQLLKHLEGVLEREREGLSVVYVPSLCPWTDRWVEHAASLLGRKTSRRRFVRVVFEADARQSWAWVGMPARRSASHVAEFGLKPWGEAALQQWMMDSGLAAGDLEAQRYIADATGGWGYFIIELGRRCADGASHRWRDHLEEVVAMVEDRDAWARLIAAPEEARHVLKAMAEYGDPVSIEEFVELTGVSAPLVQKTLEWADLLSFVTATSQGRWRLNPLIAQIVAR